MKLISIVIPFKIIDESIYLWVQKRQSNDDLNGLLEFPGGKIEPNERPLAAAIREVKEEVGVSLNPKSLKLLNSMEFSDSLTIFIFLTEDNFDSFEKAGFYPILDLLSEENKILPNNRHIIEQVKRYFEDFKV